MRIGTVLALAMFLSGSATNGSQLTPDEKRTLELKPAVVLVVVSVKVEAAIIYKGQLVKLENLQSPYLTTAGSGFIFRHDGYLITNGHVVQNAKINDPQAERQLVAKVRAKVFKAFNQFLASQGHAPLTEAQESQIPVRYHNPTLTVFLANGVHVPGELTPNYSPEIGVGKDVAIVKIAGTNLPSVPLGDSTKVREQDRIMVIGYPGVASDWGGNDLISSESALVPSVTSGSISAIKTLAATNAPVLQSDAAITHGNSGGPAFDAKGEVIGIATAGAETQGFNFFVPINTAWEFVRREGVAPDAGPFTQHWRRALDLFDEKKCRMSVPEFDDVLQFMPGLPDAARLRASAVECVDSESMIDKVSDSPVGPWLLYGLVGLTILGIGAMVLRSRSATPARAARPAGGMAGGTRLEAPPPATLPPAQSYGNIQATAGALSGKTFKVPKEGLLIGRSPKCQVILPDDTISSEHAWIVPSGNEVVVIDKGSSNGTYVNSVESPKVSKIGLRNGDRIFFGKKGNNVFTYFNS
jgi:serine protease Do